MSGPRVPPLPVTLFADFTCPYSYVTEAALARLTAENGLEVRYRALELYPDPTPLPAPADEPGWEEAVAPLAGAERLTLAAPRHRPRTRKAHEAARFAASRQMEPPLRSAIYQAYWAEERDIGRIDVLLDLAAGIGLEPEELRIALDIDRYREEVLHDGEIARKLRIPGAPALYLGTGPAAGILLGAQSSPDLDAALRERL